MNWLHNIILLTISFLISRLLVDSRLHHVFIQKMAGWSSNTVFAMVNGILFISYALSLFFSNTVVAITMVPVISGLTAGIRDTSLRNRTATHFILALIYGANIGGMGSLTGTYLNIVSVSYMEILGIADSRYVTYFSWLIVGIPVSLLLLAAARLVLLFGEKKLIPAGEFLLLEKSVPIQPLKRYSGVFLINLVLFIVLTALQFFLRPDPVWKRFNIIDIIFILYLALFIFFAFLYPRGGFSFPAFRKNVVFFLFFILFSPVIFINETLKEAGRRFHLRGLSFVDKIDNGMIKLFNGIWFCLFREKWESLRSSNRNAHISANRIIFDLPFWGMTFMGLVLIFLLFLINLGNDPATPQLDGYVFQFLERLTSGLFIFSDHLFILFFMIILMSILLTEIVSNTTVVLVTFPIIAGLSVSGGFNPFFLMLAVAVASNGAFMSPIATSVNAVSYAGLPGISLKKMLQRGLILNLCTAAYFSLVFFLFNRIF